MAGQELSPSRLEAFSDGVIAIIITIMVLGLKAPHDAHARALLALWPDFLSYLISFAFVAIYWVNHHFLFKHIKAVDERILWSNILLLFTISLIPFSTAYMGATRLAAFPMALYAGVLIVCGGAFASLRAAVAARIDDKAARKSFNGVRVHVTGIATMLILLVAIGVAFIQPAVALALIFISSTLHAAPLTRQDA